jgi:uncharacterized membrane protein YeiH
MVHDVIGWLVADLVVQGESPRESVADALGVAQTIIQYAGTIAFAISAAVLAGRRRMNVVGVVVFGVLVAVGGGTTRDILLGDLPVYWVADPAPLFVAGLAAAVTIPLAWTGGLSALQRYDVVQVSDSAGLALFTVLGTNVALETGAGAVSAVLVGVVSGVGGGIIRDTIVGRTPEVLASGSLYASAAIGGSILNLMLLETSLWPPIASTIAVAFIVILRLLSLHFGWGVPRFVIGRSGDSS